MTNEFELMMAEEEALAQVQTMALRLIRDKKLTQKELADLMGVTPSYISQILADEPKNLTIKKVANLFFHLGSPLEFVCRRITEMDQAALTKKAMKKAASEARRSAANWHACGFDDDLENDQELVAA